ncbi:uncharacterized protein AMSG_08469 [Thecamonas trahens ATCC 50062]|uniref:Uncharacterized protein n=1 Tax=Thecamonas trahens ATCC 50062 TaxID=461836 RepID=A0A0L0DKP3_THETB|nr:hypothetical protein AMSG_08469 [Thecamonas trahens ATCC 50062]KNC52606.1 hypothetical protein AMSG_08469 [Thecamonas trahens ATCC 50062]|eukprot:XP_013755165.1 hypothetical protein AMSG_08469 [Thecamonas trahens ATCC 50062]
MLFAPILIIAAWLMIPTPVLETGAPSERAGATGEYWLFGGAMLAMLYAVTGATATAIMGLAVPAMPKALAGACIVLAAVVAAGLSALVRSMMTTPRFERWIHVSPLVVIGVVSLFHGVWLRFSWWPRRGKAAFVAARLRPCLLVEQWFRAVIIVAAAMIGMPIWSMTFVSIFRELGTSQTWQIGLGLAYNFTFYPLYWLLVGQARRVDAFSRVFAPHFGWSRPRQIRPLAVWAATLFPLLFYRILFTTVTSTTTFLIFQLVNTTQEVALYPLRMTSLYLRLRLRLRELLLSWNRPGVVLLRFINRGLFVPAEVYRHKTGVEYFFVAQAQRMSLISFGCFLFLLHNTGNSAAYPYQRNQETYDRLVTFVWIMLALEWSGSTLVWAIMRFSSMAHDCVLSGAQWTLRGSSMTTALLYAVFGLHNVYLFLHSKDVARP